VQTQNASAATSQAAQLPAGQQQPAQVLPQQQTSPPVGQQQLQQQPLQAQQAPYQQLSQQYQQQVQGLLQQPQAQQQTQTPGVSQPQIQTYQQQMALGQQAFGPDPQHLINAYGQLGNQLSAFGMAQQLAALQADLYATDAQRAASFVSTMRRDGR
jgi:hypothetical protein